MNRLTINLVLLAWGAVLGLIVYIVKNAFHIQPGTKAAMVLYTIVIGGGIILGTRFVGRMKPKSPPGS